MVEINNEPIEVWFNQKQCTTLFETIKSVDKRPLNLFYHQERVNRAYKDFYKTSVKFNLKDIIKPPLNKLLRIKVVYNKEGVVDISYHSYKPKNIKKILLIENKEFEYSFKYLNRDFFEYLYKKFDSDEFIITQNGYLRDFTIGNIALFKEYWISPKKALLEGTALKRFSYILKREEVSYKSLAKCSRVALLNAMVDFRILK